MATDEQIIAYVRLYNATNGYSPSLREIGAGTGLSSTSSVWFHLDSLRDRGLIEWTTNHPRTIRIVAPVDEVNE